MATYQREQYRPQTSVNFLPYILLAIVSLVLVWQMWPRNPPPETRTVTPRGELAEEEKSNIALFKESLPSVVHINTAIIKECNFNVMKIPKGTGSGFVWDHQGHIVTNNHVIAGANSAVVVMSDQTSYNASLVGRNKENDVAVLRIDAPANRLRPIPIGESANLQVGQRVYAIGNPFGLNGSLTTGVVSGLDRELETHDGATLKGLIQTDAAINPGNSGGPLLDSAGRLIGMNAAILSPSGAFAGVGFAIPVDKVKVVAEAIIRHRPTAWQKPASHDGLEFSILNRKDGNLLTWAASHHGDMPPLTHSVWPVINEASSLAKYRQA
jgi:S1-C subfamily serine protease